MNTRSSLAVAVATGVFLVAASCAEYAMSNGLSTIEGSVWYRERIALPPQAEIQVSLQDVARMDTAADVVATTRFTPGAGPPWQFSLAYDPQKLHDKGRYVLRARIEAQGKLLFTNTSQTPAFEDSPVEIRVSPVGGLTPDPPDSGLTKTHWVLTALGDQVASPGVQQRDVDMVLDPEETRVSGFSGCNRFSGGYALNEDRLGFTALASTRMACPEGMEQEQRFLAALGQVARFILSGDSLALYSADDRLLLRFRAVAPKRG